MERIWLDDNRRPLLHLFRNTREQAAFVKEETLPELRPIGTVESIPGTGVRVYAGPDGVQAGTYRCVVGTYGQTMARHFDLQREVTRLAVGTRWVQREGGLVLPIARFSLISRKWTGMGFSGSVEVNFEAASPYWWGPIKTANLTDGVESVVNAGDGEAPVRLSLRATSPLVNPEIVTDAGRTRFQGTVAPGQTLVIDGAPGRWAVTVDGQDRHKDLRGVQPALHRGRRTITIHAPGAVVQAAWSEGYLL